MAGADLVEAFLEQNVADPTWRAIPAALVNEELQELRRDLVQVTVPAKDHQRPSRRQVVEADRPIEVGFADHLAAGATDLGGHRLFRVAHLQDLS